MKGTFIGLIGGGISGFVLGCLTMSRGSEGSMVLGIVMALLVVVVLGAIVILLAGVLTRNMQLKQAQRQVPDYPQTPYIMLGGPSQPQPSLAEPTYQRQLPIMDRKQQVEYEDF